MGLKSSFICDTELLRELETLVDQVDAALASEASALKRAEEAEKHANSLQSQLASLQVTFTFLFTLIVSSLSHFSFHTLACFRVRYLHSFSPGTSHFTYRLEQLLPSATGAWCLLTDPLFNVLGISYLFTVFYLQS